jgi:hypothetical protein
MYRKTKLHPGVFPARCVPPAKPLNVHLAEIGRALRGDAKTALLSLLCGLPRHTGGKGPRGILVGVEPTGLQHDLKRKD